jgi:hypothetical protein
MVEAGSVENIREVGVEAGRVVKAGRVVNIRLVVYRIAQVIRVTDEISENEVEMIVWALTSFLNGGCRDFLVVVEDHYRDFLVVVEDHYRDFLVVVEDHYRDFLVGVVDDCRDFAPVEVKIKMIVSGNCVLLMIHEVVALLIVDEVVLWVIAAFLE